MANNPICVAVTGANGFLGRPTIKALAECNFTVVEATRHPHNNSVYVDITDSSSWPNLFKKKHPTRLIHLAWDYLNNFDDPRHYLELLPAHLTFIEWCVKNGITDITVAGTCYEYGSVDGELCEELPAKPVVAYAIAKDALRRSIEHLSRKTGFSFKWARIFFVSGDEEADKGVFKLIRDSAEKGETAFPLTWGEQLRDYLPRKDTAKFLAHLCLQNDILGIVNCCSGKPLSMRRMLEEYAKQWPNVRLDFGKVTYRPFEPMAFWGSRRRMDKVLASRISGI